MRIGFIGAGRVGYTMGKYLALKGCDITGYYSRTYEHAEDASRFTDTRCFKNAEDLINECDAVFLTVSDSCIKTVFDEIKTIPGLSGKIVCHTSGALSSKVFEDASCQVYGYSIHPVYAVSDRYTSYKDFSNAFITIEGHEKYLSDIRNVFSCAGFETEVVSTDEKIKYHAACTIASNFVCGIYGMAADLLEQCGFNQNTAEKALNGLFLDNAKGIVEKGAVGQLTGPLERGDAETLRKHLSVLSDEDKSLYLSVSQEILKIAKRKNKDRSYSEIENLLKGGQL